MRKRPSGARLQNDGSHGHHESSRYTDSWRTEQAAMPAWQVLVLLLAAVAVFYLVLSITNPRARASQAVVGHARPKCYPMADDHAVRMLGPENKAYSRTIATSSPGAQVLFNLGLLAAHGFNQVEATSWLQAALQSDPSCAMCYWGLAYVQGPTPNKLPGKLGDKYPSFQPTHATDALQHIQSALRLNSLALQAGLHDQQVLLREEALIRAMAERYASGAAALKAKKWWQHETAYAERLRELAEREKDDADIYAFAAEAHMNLSPWDYYNETGHLRPTAAVAEKLLLSALALKPNHTHALHLHIHITEAGTPGEPPSQPGTPLPPNAAARGLGSAETLVATAARNGHLLHMPSHTFVRVGQYRKAVEANKAAYQFDIERGASCVVPYLPEHNVNMLVYAASMAGMYHTAYRFAKGMRNLRDRVPDTWMARGNEWTSLPLVLIRYGSWEHMLAQAPPPRDARGVTAYGGPQFASVVYHAGRVLALAARAQAAAQQVFEFDDPTAFELASKSLSRREKEVEQEHKLLKNAISSVPTEPTTKPGPPPGLYASAYRTLARIMGQLVSARLALLHNNTAAAIDALTEAVALEDKLGYMEPPRVHQPTGQCLGWVLLQAGRPDEAAAVYKQDLQQHPRNGWSLLGLLQVAKAKGAGSADQQEAQQRWQQAWSDAEVQIGSSCPALSEPFAG